MNGLMKTLNLLFITVVGGLLVVVIQENYVKAPSLDGIAATAIAGPWAPRNAPAKNGLVDLSGQWDLLNENNSLARIVIENNGSKTVSKGRIRLGKSLALPDALITDDSDKSGVYLRETNDIPFPVLAPGDKFVVFLWDKFGFGWPNYLDSMHIYSELGEIPVKLSTHIDASGYGDDDKLESFWGFIKHYWWLVLPVFGIIMFVLTVISDLISAAYIRKMLIDDDFWLSERQRIEDVGYKAFSPNMSDPQVSPKLLSKFEKD